MTSVFIIAECGSSWRFHSQHFMPQDCDCELQNAYRMIEAAKSCGADAVKFQWCSSAKELASRRGEPQYEKDYEYVVYDPEWLPLLKGHADKVGIEFMCTAFLPQDVAVIAPLVKRFKVAAKESMDRELCSAIRKLRRRPLEKKQIILSTNTGDDVYAWRRVSRLHCVSKYPCPIEEIALAKVRDLGGLSDHTGHVLTGAVAVGAGARVIEAHIKHYYTPKENPDYPHSHFAWLSQSHITSPFQTYVQNIRTAEKMCQ
jgi:sialic acid synthase SpsE